MTTLTVTLSDPLDRFVADRVAAGLYATREEAALDLLERARDDHARKVAALNSAIQVGLDQLDRGEAIEITDIDAHFDELEAEVDAELEARVAKR